MRSGDVLIGLKSSGPHSNGYSLIRKILKDNGLEFSDVAPYSSDNSTLGEDLLSPTCIYVKSLLGISQSGLVKGMAHITGGGFTENIPRILPGHLYADIDVSTWSLPPVFSWLKTAGNVESCKA